MLAFMVTHTNKGQRQSMCTIFLEGGRCIKSLLLNAVIVMAVVTCHRSRSPAGVWKGEMNGLPAVEIVLQEDTGRLGGTITFFFQRKDDGKWKVERQNSEPLQNV